jgi:hypothetical protein
LARCIAAVAGGTLTIGTDALPHDRARARAVALLDARGQQTNTLYACLRAAEGTGAYPSATVASSSATRHLLQSADQIGAAADLIASHVTAPLTPEGEAIRAGGAVREGSALVCRVAWVAAEVDRHLIGWLANGQTIGGSYAEQYAADLAPARWAASGALADLAQQTVRRATGTPNLRLLALAPPTSFDAAPTPSDPAARFRAVRDWLWQHPEEIDTRHHRAGTQLGLGIAVLAGGPPRRAAWRAAVTAAIQLTSGASDGPASVVAAELTDLAATVRDLLHQPDGRSEPVAALGPALPELARALHAGLAAGLTRHAVFIVESGLAQQPVRLVYRHQTTVRAATSHDLPILAMGRSLSECARLAGGPLDRLPNESFAAAQAFPLPPRPGARGGTTSRETSPPPAMQRTPQRHR